jgi:phage shock protein C
MNGNDGGKRLIRPRKGRIVSGVCMGLAEYFGVDPTLVRVIFGAVTVFTVGWGALLYLAGWVLIPEEGEPASIAERLINKSQQ